MSARAFADGMAAALVNDAIFSAAVAALIGTTVTTVLRANTPLAEIPSGKWPCFVIEHGSGVAQSVTDGDDSLTIGGGSASYASDLDVLLLWKDQDRDRAAQARASLSDLFAGLMLRNSQPGDIHGAMLTGWETDQGGQHPTHVFAAQIRGVYTLYRS